jgi:acetolactate synthase-1/2/3 large subunit
VLDLLPGPGVTNALTAIAEAYADSSPVLLLASQLPSSTVNLDREDFHQLRDVEAVLGSVTQWGVRPGRAEDIGPAVKEAFRRFDTGRPRPCYLDLPMDILSAKVGATVVALQGDRHRHASSAFPLGDVHRAAEALMGASRPLLLVGGGAWRASGLLRELVELLSIPVVMTSSGKGIVAEDHPLSLGDGGWRISSDGGHRAGRHDLALAFRLSRPVGGRKIIRIVHVDIDQRSTIPT